MDEQVVRIECLKLAMASQGAEALALAKQFADFVLDRQVGEPAPAIPEV